MSEMKNQHHPSERSARLMKLAGWTSLFVAVSLIFAKAGAWVMSGSVSLLGSLADSSLDLMASLINFIAIRTALEPADKDHRFGHGKAEAIAGLFQAFIIIGAALFLLWQSGLRLLDPVPLVKSEMGIGVSILAIVMTLALVMFQKHVVRETGSVAVAADSLHYTGDLMMNMAVIVALGLTMLDIAPWIDGVFGIGIAFYIAKSAFEIGRTSIDMLMDKEFGEEARETIFNLVLGNDDVKGIHDLRTRKSGLQSFIQFHIELEPTITLFEAHAIADEVEATVGEEFSTAEIIIHTDPLGLEGHNQSHKELD
jgi:ferrous-iron efflux pump FieF